MSLLWPGEHRAGGLVGDAALLDAMLAVESAWSQALVAAGVAPGGAAVERPALARLVAPADVADLAVAAEATGTPVAPLVALLRDRLGADAPAARYLHRGLTSQDVVDSALVICSRAAVLAITADLDAQVRLLDDLVRTHRATPTIARTLTQDAVPTTFGLKAAQWLAGVLDARDGLAALRFPAQLGGAAGTMSALVELAAHLPAPLAAAEDVRRTAALALGLEPSPPWHTVRTTVTRLADAATACTAAWGHLANDVLALSRSEVGELAEGVAGGSSTMPHKANPVLAVQVRRAALAAPGLTATLHLAAADVVDERTPGGWHAEWPTLRDLLRRTVVAGSQTTDLLAALRVRPGRMAERLRAATDAVRAEQASVAALAGRDPEPEYLGLADAFVEDVLARAARHLDGSPR